MSLIGLNIHHCHHSDRGVFLSPLYQQSDVSCQMEVCLSMCACPLEMMWCVIFEKEIDSDGESDGLNP